MSGQVKVGTFDRGNICLNDQCGVHDGSKHKNWAPIRMLPQLLTHINCKVPCVSVSYHSSGAVELENLPLRKDALREFDLPFEVKAGEKRAPVPLPVHGGFNGET